MKINIQAQSFGEGCEMPARYIFVTEKCNLLSRFKIDNQTLTLSTWHSMYVEDSNSSAYDGWNVPKVTQPYTRLIRVHFFYCDGAFICFLYFEVKYFFLLNLEKLKKLRNSVYANYAKQKHSSIKKFFFLSSIKWSHCGMKVAIPQWDVFIKSSSLKVQNVPPTPIWGN